MIEKGERKSKHVRDSETARVNGLVRMAVVVGHFKKLIMKRESINMQS